eukprot:CAMPEP_0174250812 /NCGR_PEP_ID=MMETSP0439-20130205/863_1 /TAXON_ID=0 /ORGANISM="Stereomyxa ramosa, Strain Chinc5" /LENGTH=159 /DNA_ID=CAMNT_0015330977 /DNA_START=564 /DNA_END=1043 /DNA_ORIENTATION=+
MSFGGCLTMGLRILELYLHRADYEPLEIGINGGIMGGAVLVVMALGMFLLGMSCSVLDLLVLDQTTLEMMFSKGKRRFRLIRSVDDFFWYINNVKSVLGEDILLWFWPNVGEEGKALQINWEEIFEEDDEEEIIVQTVTITQDGIVTDELGNVSTVLPV